MRIKKSFMVTWFAATCVLMLLVLVGCGGNGTSQSSASVGEVIQFGGLDWRVLDVQDDRMLIITEYAVSRMPFHQADGAFRWDSVEWHITWEDSTLQAYLNSEFMNNFSTADRARIRAVTITNSDNQ